VVATHHAPAAVPLLRPDPPNGSAGMNSGDDERGAIALRPLAIGEVLDGGMDVLRRHPGPLFAITATAVALQIALAVPLWWVASSAVVRVADGGDNGSDLLLFLATLTAASLVATLSSTIAIVVTTAAASIAVDEEAYGRPVRVAGILRRLRPIRGKLLLLTLALIGINMIIAALPIVGLIAALLGGLARLSIPAMIFERVGVGTALRRGWQVGATGDAFGFIRGLWIRFLAGIVFAATFYVISIPIAVIGLSLSSLLLNGGTPGTSALLAFTTSIVLQLYLPMTVVLAFRGGVDTMLYVDGRMRAEGLDIEWGLAARRSGPTRIVGLRR
jgi:hypothetical protein